ncbi:MAG: molybdate ABC transporter permease subunit [Pseudomonadota bacterium]
MSAAEIEIVLLSVQVALVATLACLPLAIAVAALLSRPFPGRALVDALVHAPLILPPVVTGYALLVLFGRRGPLGAPLAELGIVFAFDWTGAVLAAGIMAFPLMVRAIRLSMEAVDQKLVAAAKTLGAPGPSIFLRITLPLVAPGILAGAILGFAKALGEFGATITFVSNIPGETQTLPLAIYTALQVPGGEAAALRLVLLSAALSVAALLLSDVVSRAIARRVGGA